MASRRPAVPSGVVTVAQLQTRLDGTGGTGREPVTAATAVSVGSLLRREGRAPHSADRPLVPRQRDEAIEKAVPVRPVARRAALATGALLAAGSVFGAAVLSDAEGRTVPAAAGDGRAGQAAQDALGSTSPLAALLGLAGGSGTGPDAGTAAPTSWMTVAFPTTDPGPPGLVGTPSTRSPASPGTGAPAGTGAPTAGEPIPAAAPAPAPTPTPAPAPAPAGPVGTLTAPLTEPVQDTGGSLGGPVGGAVSELGGAVEGTAGTVDGLLGASSAPTPPGPASSRSSSDDDAGPGPAQGGPLGGVTGPIGGLLG